MGISFKVSKSGKRFHPKPPPPAAAPSPVEGDKPDDVVAVTSKKSDNISFSARSVAGDASDSKGIAEIKENEVSFCLNIFPDGYSISKPIESGCGRETSGDVPKFLHPYDRASETMFSAIESGRLPGDILDDIPCKYVNGTVVCEVRDYRESSSDGLNAASGNRSPVVTRVRLRMSLENIVKDIPAISESDWTYGDLMEVESRILKALQPQLSLDPTPQLDKLSDFPGPSKLNFDLRSMRRKRLMQIPDIAVTSNNLHGKKICLERAPESSRLGDPGSLSQQTAYENSNIQNPNTMLPVRNNSFGPDGSLLTPSDVPHLSKYSSGLSSPRMMKDQRLSSPGGQDVVIPFSDNSASSIHGKRENQDGQSSPLMNKKARPDGNQQHVGPQMDGLHGSESQWKNTLMQQQSIGRGIHQYPNSNMQKFSQQAFEGGMNQEGGPSQFNIGQQQGIRYNLKEEPVETERLDRQDSDLTGLDPRLQQRMPAQFMRPGFPQAQWNNLGQALDISNNPRKEDSYQKRKFVQSPHVSAGGLPQSPLSSRSGEFSSGSHQFGAAVSSGHVQKEKSVVSGSDPMQRQNQVQAVAKRRSNSLPKTPAGVGSPASVSTMSVPIITSSPSVGSHALGDHQSMLERFSKIEVVTMRCQLNCKKNKVDEYPMRRKPNVYSAQDLMTHLSSDVNNEILKDETYKLSKSLVAGSMNSCKTRILNFVQTERIIQGNSFQLVTKARTRMIMSEKPNDGNVAFHIGEIEETEYLAAEDYLPTLPNAHIADLVAAQFSSLMARDGYDVEDRLQPKAARINPATPSSETQQFSEGGGPAQPQPNDAARPGGSTGNPLLNSPHNVQTQRMLPQGNNNNQAIQMSQGLLQGVSNMPSRPIQGPEQQQQMPAQQSQFQRSPMNMLPSSSMTSMHQLAGGPLMGNNKHSSLQLQLLQQQQQRKMMATSMGNVGMGNIGNSNNYSTNNMVGLGGLGGLIGGSRGGVSGGSRVPSGIGNVNLSSAANITNAIRNGTLTPEQATLMKLRLQQNRAGMGMGSMGMGMGMGMGMNMNTNVGLNMLGGSQSGLAGGGAAARQMHSIGSSGLSMLGPALARAGIGQMQQQRTPMGQMGPPKLVPAGVNPYMNQQQQQMYLQQQLQLQQQQQQQQQIQQPQETNSPLQAVVSPPQVGSPSGHQLGQQQQQAASPQQRTPMSPQLSSGANAMHQMVGANPDVGPGPASPQLSSQTMGSVGSIANSPMDMPGVNKSNS